MKKYLLSVCLLVILISVLTACNNESTYSVVNNAIEKTLGLPSFELEWDRTLTFETDSTTDILESVIKVKAENYGSENQKFYAESYSKVSGVEILIYQEGDFYYVSSDDGNFKYHKDTAHNNSGQLPYEYTCNLGYLFVKYPKEYFSDAVVSNNDDGSKTVLFNVPHEFLFGEDPENFGNEKIQITINSDGYISMLRNSSLTSYPGYYVGSTQFSEIEVFTFIYPGQTVKIEPIEGYKDFEEKFE